MSVEAIQNRRMIMREGRILLSIAFTLIFFIIGVSQPQLILLDGFFGLAYYFADLFGMWKPGLLWVANHHFLSFFCFLGWPLFISALLGTLTTSITLRIYCERSKYSRLSAIVFVIAILGLILSVQVEPGSVYISRYSYSSSNY